MHPSWRVSNRLKRRGLLGIVIPGVVFSLLLAGLMNSPADLSSQSSVAGSAQPRISGGSVPYQSLTGISYQDSYTLTVSDTLYDADSPALLGYFHWFVRSPGGSWTEVRAVECGPVSPGQTISDTLSLPLFASGYEVYVYSDVTDYSNWGNGASTPIFVVPNNNAPTQSLQQIVALDENTLSVTNTLYDSDAPSYPTLLTYFHWFVSHNGGTFTEVRDVEMGPVSPGQSVADTLVRPLFSPGDQVYVYTDVNDGISYGNGASTNTYFVVPADPITYTQPYLQASPAFRGWIQGTLTVTYYPSTGQHTYSYASTKYEFNWFERIMGYSWLGPNGVTFSVTNGVAHLEVTNTIKKQPYRQIASYAYLWLTINFDENSNTFSATGGETDYVL